ncbi:MAG TPA: sugar transferase [Gemmatimonadota bacterium]|nr:sugar transferase [Gemmatimonadota bacterium]
MDQRPLRLLRALLDLLAVLLGFWTSFLLHAALVEWGVLGRQSLDPAHYVNLALLFGVICIAVFWKLDLYRERASVLNLSELQAAMKGILLTAAIFLAVLFMVRLTNFSRFVTFFGFFTSAVFVLLQRRLFSAFVRKVQLGGKIARRNVLIYGCGETGKLLMKKLIQAPHKACHVVGFLDDFAPRGSRVTCRLHQTTTEVFEARVLGRLQDLAPLARELRIDELLVTVSLTNAERHHELVQLAREANVDVGVIPRFGEVRADQLEVEDLSAITVLRPSSVRPRKFYPAMKRCFDVLTASTLLIVTAPLWMLAVALILLESGWPVLFRQMRVGQDGKRFKIVKFRTMRKGVEPYQNSPQGDDDPRITRIGRLLRMGGFDELPQLINVLRGQMSMVGPRPEMPFIVEKYSALESQRLVAKPGITGIWQLSCDRHAEIHENLEYDLYYIRHQSLLLDFLILLETLFFTIGLASNVARRESLKPPLSKIPLPMPSSSSKPEPGDGYILVALDQRRTDTLPESWITCAPAFYVLASHGHLKLLVAPDNVAVLDGLVEEPASERVRAVDRTEYVPYVDRSQLRALTYGAKMVVTDLDHVDGWARDGNVDVLFVEGQRMRWYNRSHGCEALVADLAERISIDMPDDRAHQVLAAGTPEPSYDEGATARTSLALDPPQHTI